MTMPIVSFRIRVKQLPIRYFSRNSSEWMLSLTVLIIVVQISDPVMVEPPAGRFVAEGSPQLVHLSIVILHNILAISSSYCR